MQYVWLCWMSRGWEEEMVCKINTVKVKLQLLMIVLIFRKLTYFNNTVQSMRGVKKGPINLKNVYFQNKFSKTNWIITHESSTSINLMLKCYIYKCVHCEIYFLYIDRSFYFSISQGVIFLKEVGNYWP